METEIKYIQKRHAMMLSDDVNGKLKKLYWRTRFVAANTCINSNDRGPKGHDEPIIPYLKSQKIRVYTGTNETGSFNHHSHLVKFKNKYYLAWSNGKVNEEDVGQRVLFSSSVDGVNWEEIKRLDDKFDPQCISNCCGMYVGNGVLYTIVMTEIFEENKVKYDMPKGKVLEVYLSIYSTTDGEEWVNEGRMDKRIKWILENPKLTSEGRLLCVCATTDLKPAMLLWPGDDLLAEPQFIYIDDVEDANFIYSEASWYETDKKEIVVFWRDEEKSLKLYVNTSIDCGKSFTTPCLSDIPDSVSRVSTAKLSDGRYVLCNNAVSNFLDRSFLSLLISDDGYTFNNVYILLDDPTSQRRFGFLKVDGYQYPCLLAEKDKLLISYSVNKEDIEVMIIDIKDI